MATLFPNCKFLKWYIFVLVFLYFNRNTIGHHLGNEFVPPIENETKDVCEKTEHLFKDMFEEKSSNIAPFAPQLFKNILNSNISNSCKDSLVIYFNEVMNLKPWALEMLDASGKIPSSFFSISLIDYGSLDDCIKTEAVSNEGDSLFKGKFCMMHLRHPLFQTPHGNPYIGKSYNEAFGVPPDWIRHDIENSIILRFGFYGGICMPSTCSDDDLNKAISTLVEPLDLDVSLTDCQVEEPLKVPFSAKLCMVFLVVLILVCMSGTILDLKDCKMKEIKLKSADESLIRQLLKAFSPYTNAKELFVENARKMPLDFLHGFRFLLCFLILYAHTLIYPTYWKELRFKNYYFIFEVCNTFMENNGTVIVDSYFVISGFLVTFSSIRKINIFESIVQRYYRLLVPVLFMTTLYYVLPLISSGPVWNSSWEHEQENCNQNGWKLLLYIQNYGPMNEICMVHTWFIANTMQHLIVSFLLINALKRYTKVGIVLVLLSYFLPCIYYVYVSLEHQYPFLSLNSVRYSHLGEEMVSTIYAFSSYHFSANLVGMLSCMACLKYRNQKLSKIWIITGWIVSILSFYFTLAIVYMPTKNFMIMALYNSFKTTFISLATGWLLYICATGQGGILEKAFSAKALVPLSRISYSIFLVHSLYLVFRDSINAERFYVDRIAQIGEFFAYVLFSIFAAFILYIVVEEPFNKIYDILKKRILPPTDARQTGTALKKNGTEKR